VLKSELKARDRWELAEEDFRRVCRVTPNSQGVKQNDCWRINGVRDLAPHQVAVLHELCHFRDQKARALDRPLFKVVGDRSLVNIAAASPDSLRKLEKVPGVSRKQVQWIGRGLLAAVKRGLQKTPPPRPRRKRPSDQYLDRVDNLRAWRKATARYLKVESDVVLPKDLLYSLAEGNPQTQGDMERILHAVPWRLEQFGDEIFDLLRASNF
jgi:ribonuclease D